MKNDLNDLKKLVLQLISGEGVGMTPNTMALVKKVFSDHEQPTFSTDVPRENYVQPNYGAEFVPQKEAPTIEVEEVLSLADKEKEMIQKALEKHRNKRKYAAKELGISERTLYRKIKEYNLK